LRYFVAVAEEMHFGRAAERLHMAQQPLSAQIRELERELGCDVFDRAENRIRLTPAGNVLLRESRAILSRTSSAVELTRRAARGEVGIVRLGYCSTAMEHIVPNALRSLKGRYPDLGVSLQEMSVTEQIAALEADAIDVGFAYQPLDERTFGTLDLHEEGFVVALCSTHPLAALERIVPRALASEPYVAFSATGNADCAKLANLLLRIDQTEHAIAYEVADGASALGLVSNGMGFALLPERAALPRPGVAFRPLDATARLRFAAVWSRRAEPRLVRQRFIETLRSLQLLESAAS